MAQCAAVIAASLPLLKILGLINVCDAKDGES